MEFTYFIFTRMPGESYRRRLRSLLLCRLSSANELPCALIKINTQVPRRRDTISKYSRWQILLQLYGRESGSCAGRLHGQRLQYRLLTGCLPVRRTFSPGSYSRRQTPSSRRKLHEVAKHRRVVLQWVPAHCGLPGNEKADELAKLRPKEDSRTTCSVTFQERKTLF